MGQNLWFSGRREGKKREQKLSNPNPFLNYCTEIILKAEKNVDHLRGSSKENS